MFNYTIQRHIFDLYTLQTVIFNNISQTVVTATGDTQSVTFGFSSELSLTLQNSLQTLVLNYTDNIQESDGISLISKLNKKHTVMAANEKWIGMWEDISRYATVTINCQTDKKGILTIQFSNDALETESTIDYIIKPNTSFIEIKTVTYRYFKLIYVNDFEAQTSFCLHSMAHLYRSKGPGDVSVPIEFNIKQESILTGSNFRCESMVLSVPANSVGILTYTKKYRISVLELRFSTEEIQRDDIINCYIAKNTTIGVLGSNGIIGDSIIYVSPTVIEYIQLGYYITITDGTNTQDLGECVSIIGNKLTITNALLFNFSLGSLINMTIQNIKNYIIGHSSTYTIGSSTNRSSSVPPNTLLTLEYTNKSAQPKTLYFYYDMLY